MRRFAIALTAACAFMQPQAHMAAVKPLLAVSPYTILLGQADSSHATALGVFPLSRDIDSFYREVSAGAPTARVTGAHGVPGALGKALRAQDIAIRTVGRQAKLFVYGDPSAADLDSSPPARASELSVISDPAPSNLAPDMRIGSPDGRTPLYVSINGPHVLLEGSITHRPGIVTPYDIASTILQHFEVATVPSSFIGRPLRAGTQAADIAALDRRFERDSGYQQSLIAWTVIVGLGVGCVLAFILWFAWSRSLARRVTTGAGFASAGYLIGLFIPSPRGDVRAAFVFVLLVIGLVIKPPDPIRALAKAFIAVAVATTLLEIASALHPQGEPALSFWGNPIISWRFYGLLNYQAAFIAGGALVATLFLERRPYAMAALVLAALVVTGAPMLGANFVGVLTLGFGGAFAVISCMRKAMRASTFGYSAIIAGGAFALALAVGASVGNSHGARAANEISSGGAHALAMLVTSRLRLNIEAIRAFPGGIVFALMFLAQFVNMIRWSLRNSTESLGLRIAIASCSLTGLAALLLEDSGFKMSAVQGFPALILWSLAVMKSSRAGRLVPATSEQP